MKVKNIKIKKIQLLLVTLLIKNGITMNSNQPTNQQIMNSNGTAVTMKEDEPIFMILDSVDLVDVDSSVSPLTTRSDPNPNEDDNNLSEQLLISGYDKSHGSFTESNIDQLEYVDYNIKQLKKHLKQSMFKFENKHKRAKSQTNSILEEFPINTRKTNSEINSKN